jgi:hypothetical protein
LTILALLLPIIIPALHHPASLGLSGYASLGKPQNMCLAGAVGANLPTDRHSPSHHRAPACALCQAMHAIGGFALPPLSTMCMPSGGGTVLTLRLDAERVAVGAGFLPPPRGPPNSV